ncbi:MAG: NAD(P)-dependent oxidoreductase [Verrucomicrobiia bacterium]|tara:strand:+ start:1910 stop:2749 length:840 start_codon:yes stop_codon:yes gene_type:complete
MMNTSPSVGVLGLGIIGSIWARHYHAAGILAGAWNRTAQPDFPQWQDTATIVAKNADIIQIAVADPAAVQSVLDAIAPALDSTKTVVQSSTIDPESSDRFRTAVIATGARYLECPFTGSKPAAEAKQTVFYQGGDDGLIAELEPVLSLVSAHRIRIGDHRQACALKLAMNLNVSAQMQGFSEALTICRRAGIGNEVFQNAIERNSTYSGLLQLKWPQVRDDDYSPFFSIKHMHKDMRLAENMPEVSDLQLLALVRERLATAEANGLGDEDFAALFKLLG